MGEKLADHALLVVVSWPLLLLAILRARMALGMPADSAEVFLCWVVLSPFALLPTAWARPVLYVGLGFLVFRILRGRLPWKGKLVALVPPVLLVVVTILSATGTLRRLGFLASEGELDALVRSRAVRPPREVGLFRVQDVETDSEGRTFVRIDRNRFLFVPSSIPAEGFVWVPDGLELHAGPFWRHMGSFESEHMRGNWYWFVERYRRR